MCKHVSQEVFFFLNRKSFVKYCSEVGKIPQVNKMNVRKSKNRRTYSNLTPKYSVA